MSKTSPSLIAPVAIVLALTAFMGAALLNVGQTGSSAAPYANSAGVSQTAQDNG